jgi:lipid II:glycine glycyltransferase (peptidoglycan interpeptide bridge formation enzyme)
LSSTTAPPDALPRNWFWNTQEWRSYCAAYGSEWENPLHGPSYVIDLTATPGELLRRMSKGHRSAIVKGEKYLHVDITADHFDEYRAMHRVANGRDTRPETWSIHRGWLDTGQAELFSVLLGDRPLGFAFVIVHGDGAYYASAANDPHARQHPIGQVAQWHAIRWLKSAGFAWYSLGEGYTEGIGRFKKGFGGVLT